MKAKSGAFTRKAREVRVKCVKRVRSARSGRLRRSKAKCEAKPARACARAKDFGHLKIYIYIYICVCVCMCREVVRGCTGRVLMD